MLHFSVREAPTRLLIRQGDTVLGDRVEVRLNFHSCLFLYNFIVFCTYIAAIPLVRRTSQFSPSMYSSVRNPLRVRCLQKDWISAGIFKQSVWARNWVGRNRVVVPVRQASQPGGISSLESILGLLKSLKIRALDSNREFTFAALIIYGNVTW